ncbi:MAG: aryl-sulfate sulfotransferase [Chitinophagaceae bacterium]|nr:aryl-sulfate sulfotransferase [Chitinophagaceae bacterium]
MKIIATCLLLQLTFGLQQSIAQFQYVSPMPGSVMINPEHNIIIREGHLIDPATVKTEQFSIEGASSGSHVFKLILANDGKTILLQPEMPFNFNEVVTVTITKGLKTKQGQILNGFTFKFQTHRAYVAEEQQRFKEMKEQIQDEETLLSADETNEEISNREIDGMFEITTNINPSPGDIFFDSFSGNFQPNSYTGYQAITTSGDSVFFREVTALNKPSNFNQNEKGYFGIFNGSKNGFDLLDSNFNVIDTYYPANGYEADEHEFLVLTDGHVLFVADEYQVLDLSVYDPSYSQSCTVTGAVIQEFDAAHHLVFEWRSFDHIEVPEALHKNLTFSTVDYVHTNSIEIDNDGNIIASHRTLDQVTKIDRNTGEFIWRMGGVMNEFTFINEPQPFTYQHDARRIDNGHITLFDNGVYHVPQESAAKEYAVDEVNKTATLVWSYKHPDTNPNTFLYYSAMGSVQRLTNGNTFINWGWRLNTANPSMTEITPEGTIVWELKLNAPKNIITYRSHKYVWNPCARPTQKTLKSKEVTSTAATIKWAGVANVESYLLQYKKHSESAWLEKTVLGTKDSKKLTGLTANTKYDWRLQTWCDADGIKKSGFTEIKKFTTLPQKIFLNEPTDEISFLIYPNPAHDILTVSMNHAGASQIRLLNMFGIVMIVRELNETDDVSLVQIPLHSISAGNYLLEISNSFETQVQKVVIE